MATMDQVIQNAHSNPSQNRRTIPMPIAQLQNGSVSVKPPVCSECDGKGYFRYDVPLGHIYFGRFFPCPACNADAVTHNSGLNPQERKISLEDIEIVNRPGAKSMTQAAHTFLSNNCKGFLTIHGDYGNGKSTVMKGMVNACLEKGFEARYITMTEVMAYAREAFESTQSGDTDYGRITKLAAVRVLFIDELDKARITEYAREVQTHLFDIRYRRAEEMGTVVAWNGTFSSLDLPWVRSRLSEFTVVENKDADMRPLIGGMA